MARDQEGHSHIGTSNGRRLAIALVLATTFIVAEVIGSCRVNSLALLSDAVHMFTGAAALTLALAGIRIGQQPADERRTFGSGGSADSAHALGLPRDLPSPPCRPRAGVRHGA